jgi:hypothetical protein
MNDAKDSEGIVSGMIVVLSLHLPDGTGENHNNPQLG